MKRIRNSVFLAASTLLLMSGMASAQDAVDDEADVWVMIESQWAAEEKGERMLADNFSGWQKDSPAPRSKASTIMWDRFNDEQGETVAHELYLLDIIVHGDVAIAHYLYTSAYKDKDDKVDVNNGRFTDVLVRTDDGWKFIAWHGGQD